MVGTNSVKLMRSRAMVVSTASGSKPFSMCTVPPRIRVGSTFVPATWRDGEITCGLRDFEIGQDGGGEAAIFAVGAQRALGFARGAAGVVQCGHVAGAGKIFCGRASVCFDRGEQVDAVGRGSEREHGLHAVRTAREIAAAVA